MALFMELTAAAPFALGTLAAWIAAAPSFLLSRAVDAGATEASAPWLGACLLIGMLARWDRSAMAEARPEPRAEGLTRVPRSPETLREAVEALRCR